MKLSFWCIESKRTMPLVSIIIPAFNAAETLEKAISSVLQQSYKNIELILVDGLSSDQTVNIIRKAARKDSRIRFKTEKDLGAYDAMNKGISMSKGDWIYFLGADDMLIHEYILQELYEAGYFSQEKVFYGNVIIQGDTSWAKDQEVYAGEFNLERLLARNICHQAIFYPKQVVIKAGYFNTAFIVCADWDYNLRCYAMDPFLYADKIIARFSGGGLSTTIKEDPFLKNLPRSIIRCFNLDPDEPFLISEGSPFRNIIAEYHNMLSTNTDENDPNVA